MLREVFSEKFHLALKEEEKCPAREGIPRPSQTLPPPEGPQVPSALATQSSQLRVVTVNVRVDPTSAAQWGLHTRGWGLNATAAPREVGSGQGADSDAQPDAPRWTPNPREEARCPRPHCTPGGDAALQRGSQPLSSREAQAPAPRRHARAGDSNSTHPVAAAMLARLQRHVK